ncbi:hypothetical protein NE237_031703 [Protea cynaroides]|uniref:Protein kinase domain-containing protein n=1 Tax=Protea cynaroides TaxID=273540 RepID=A0A9Q0L2M1_9MAGN|nr:hypothetical protein NE237_031703 [Protea cynaroides]
MGFSASSTFWSVGCTIGDGDGLVSNCCEAGSHSYNFQYTPGVNLSQKVVGSNNPRIFSFVELYIASKGFSEDEILDSGGFGRVYRALLPSDGTTVAVKYLSEKGEQFKKTFAAELMAVAQLRHRNLVHLSKFDRDAIAGATDSTSINVEWAMAELMLHPEELRKAKEELDQVVGMNNIVEESHLSKLPYLDAVLKEAHRLHPVVPLLVPHRSSADCTVGGYTVPKGSTVFINVWKMHRDPNEWENPSDFIPERFLADSDNYDYKGNNFNYLPFGSGRRICVGIPLATKMAFYVIASLLHSFEWEMLKKEQLDLLDKYRILTKIATPLVITPTPRLSNAELYSRCRRIS